MQSWFIKKKNIRKRYRKLKLSYKITKYLQRTKFGVSYSVFDGEELLEASIKQIRDSVDYINVIWQQKSWFGNDANNNLYPTLKKLLDNNMIDELIEYKPDFRWSPGKNERKKRNIGLKYAKKHGVKYFMPMDTDEFFITSELNSAKRFIIAKGIKNSFCRTITYGLSSDEIFPIHHGSNIQFFSKINFLSRFSKNKHAITIVDPTRHLNHIPFAKYFFLINIAMHHMTVIRKDLYKKFNNSSFDFKKLNENHIELIKADIRKKTVKYKDTFNLKNLCDSFSEK